MWGGKGEEEEEESSGPVSLQQKWLLPVSLELIVSKKLVTLLFRDELLEILQDSLPFYCFPKETRKGESPVLEEKEKYLYPKLKECY